MRGRASTNIWVGIIHPDSRSLGWDTARFSPVKCGERGFITGGSVSFLPQTLRGQTAQRPRGIRMSARAAPVGLAGSRHSRLWVPFLSLVFLPHEILAAPGVLSEMSLSELPVCWPRAGEPGHHCSLHGPLSSRDRSPRVRSEGEPVAPEEVNPILSQCLPPPPCCGQKAMIFPTGLVSFHPFEMR